MSRALCAAWKTNTYPEILQIAGSSCCVSSASRYNTIPADFSLMISEDEDRTDEFQRRITETIIELPKRVRMRLLALMSRFLGATGAYGSVV